MISFQNLTLLILSGEDKEKEVVLESIKFSNSN